MSLKSFLGKIGNFFAGLFTATQTVWRKVGPEVRNAILKGSGMVEIINKGNEAGKKPEDVVADIQTAFPDLAEEKLFEAAKDIAKGFGLATKGDLAGVVGVIAKHLDKLEGSFWAKASKYAASLAAQVLAPTDTKSSKIELLLEWAFITFVKGRIKV